MLTEANSSCWDTHLAGEVGGSSRVSLVGYKLNYDTHKHSRANPISQTLALLC